MTACAEFFELHSEDSQKIKALSAIEDRFAWEREQTASKHSPGIVANEEHICRQLHDPVYIDAATGELKPTAFDDISNKGLSSDRLAYSSKALIIEAGHARAAQYNASCSDDRKKRTLIALAHLDCTAVRAHKIDGAQAMGVFDTALEGNVAHADLCAMFVDKKSVRSARAHLFDIVQLEVLK